MAHNSQDFLNLKKENNGLLFCLLSGIFVDE